MKKLNIVLVLAILFSTNLFAEGWEKNGDITLNINQNSYSDNWVGKEKSNLTWVLNANLMAQKQLSTKVHNKNTLKLLFGQTHNQEIDSQNKKYWAKPEKTTDLIDFESMFRITLGKFVDPFASFRLESIFLDQRITNESKTFNPITLTESFGVVKVFIKEEKKEFSTRFGTAFKQQQDSTIDGIIDTNDGGLELVADYFTLLVNDMITFNSKFYLYKALYYSESDTSNDDWKSPDLNWENIFAAKLYKFLNVNLYFQLIYDKQIVDEFRIKETLGLGLSYKLF